MQSLVFLTCFCQKLSKKNLWGSARISLVKEGLRSFHMLQVLYLIILLSLFQALVFDDYSNIFSDARVSAVPCIKYAQYL